MVDLLLLLLHFPHHLHLLLEGEGDGGEGEDGRGGLHGLRGCEAVGGGLGLAFHPLHHQAEVVPVVVWWCGGVVVW